MQSAGEVCLAEATRRGRGRREESSNENIFQPEIMRDAFALG